MRYQLKTKKGSFELGPQEVINLLIGELVKKHRLDQEELATTFMEYLQFNSSLTNLSMREMAALSFQLGFFYRIFLEKNNVVIAEESINEPDNSHSDQSQAGTSCSDNSIN